MSIRITVKSIELRPRTKKGTGEIFANEQTAYAWLVGSDGKVEEYPTKITLTHWLRNGQPERPPYPVGEYALAPASFTVGDYGTVNVSPVLVALAPVKAAA